MKRVTAVLLVLLFCFAMVSCKGKSGTESVVSDPSWNKISQKKQLVVGVYTNHAPLVSPTADGFEGFDIDLLTQIASRLNLSVSFVSIDGQDAASALSSGTVDCVSSGYVYTSEGNETLTLSETYLTSRQLFVVASTSDADNLADLAGKKLGVASGSAAKKALDNSETFRAALAEIKEYATEDAVIKALLNGEIDSAAVSETQVRHYIKTGADLRALLNENKTPETLGSENYVLAFSRGSNALLKKVQDALSTMKRDGVLDEISTKWFSNYISTAEQKAADDAAKAAETASAAQSTAEEQSTETVSAADGG